MEEHRTHNRRKYDKEFKLNAVRLITDGGRRTSEVARDLGIEENNLYRWKQEFLADRTNSFPGKGKLKPEDDELRQLKKALRDVSEEREIRDKLTKRYLDNPRLEISDLQKIRRKYNIKTKINTHFA